MMKSQCKGEGNEMTKQTVAKNLSSADLKAFEDFYDEISSDWELRAEKMIQRREKALRARMY